MAVFLALAVHAQKPPVRTGSNLSPAKLNNTADSIQYTLGAFLALWISNNGFTLNTSSPLFLRAIDDILQNRTRAIPDSLITPNINAYAETMIKAKSAQQEKQLFAALKDKPGVGMFPNGMRYIVLKTGGGTRPSETDSITLHMVAKLADGTIVEDTYQSGKPFETKTNAFFPAFTEALGMMPAGSKWQLYLPAALAYGEKGTALIPPYSALVIEAELLSVRKR